MSWFAWFALALVITVFAAVTGFKAKGTRPVAHTQLMGVARWEWEQEEQAAKRRARIATELKQLQLKLAQAEAAARLQVIKTEMEARNAEIGLLAAATGSDSDLLATDRAVLRKMRHADDESAAVEASGRKSRARTPHGKRGLS